MAFGGALMLAPSVCWDGWRAAISTAAAMTQIAPTNTARGVSGLLVIDVTLVGTAQTPPVAVSGATFFERIDRVVGSWLSSLFSPAPISS